MTPNTRFSQSSRGVFCLKSQFGSVLGLADVDSSVFFLFCATKNTHQRKRMLSFIRSKDDE